MCIRASKRMHESASADWQLCAKTPLCIHVCRQGAGAFRRATMTLPLITETERKQLLANSRARAVDQAVDPLPVVRLFTPRCACDLASGCSRSGRRRHGLWSVRCGDWHARAGHREAVRAGVHRRAAQVSGHARPVLPADTHIVGVHAAGAAQRLDHGLTDPAYPAQVVQGTVIDSIRVQTVSVLIGTIVTQALQAWPNRS